MTMAHGSGGFRRGKAVLLAGVSALALAMPAAAVDLAPGGGAPWVLDSAGTFTISGADTSSGDAWIGLDTPGVQLDITGTSGAASLTIDAGKSFHLGINAASSGNVLELTGASAINSATLASGDQILVGQDSDDNRVTLNSYSTITGSSFVLGLNSGAGGNLLELKAGTSLVDLSSNLIIGNFGDDNSATLENGAVLTADGQVVLGYEAGSDGNSLTLSTGAQVTGTVGTAVGYRGSGNSVLIQSGADFTTYTTSLGSLAGADGNSLTVTGLGSTFTGTTNASFNVGGAGDNNSLMVSDGAVFTIGDRLAIGQTNTSGGNTVTVTGAGSELYAGNTRIGASGGPGGNSLVVSDGGYVSIGDIRARSGNSISLASGAIVDANVFTLDAGATLVVDVDADNAIDVDVTGTATLSGNLDVNWSGGTISNRYNLLTASTVSGTFAALDTAGFASGFVVTVDYYATGADLLIVADLIGSADLGDNQNRIAEAINFAFNSGGSISGAFVPLFGVDPADLDDALAHLTGEINAYAMTELGWSATEVALEQLTSSAACTPEADGTLCARAFAIGATAMTDGNASLGNHDTTQTDVTLGVAANARLGEDLLFGGLVSINQAHAEIDGLGKADVTSLRLGASLKQHWNNLYLGVGGVGGAGVGETERALADETPGTATGDLAQTYFGLRAELGADLALGEAAMLTPFAGLSWSSNSTIAFDEDVSGDYADLALVYDDTLAARSSLDLGIRIASGTEQGMSIGASVAYRHVLTADNAVVTEVAGLDDAAFEVTPATRPADQVLLSADAQMLVGTGASLGVEFDASLAAGYASVAGKLALTGQW